MAALQTLLGQYGAMLMYDQEKKKREREMHVDVDVCMCCLLRLYLQDVWGGARSCDQCWFSLTSRRTNF